MIILFLLISLFLCECDAIRPVFMFHGIMSDNGTLSTIIERLRMKDPNVEIINPNVFINWKSLITIPIQVLELRQEILKVLESLNSSINVVGYSQGGLICRALIEYFPDLNVHNFISLSSPQAGQYGAKLLHQIFPNLLRENVFRLFYSSAGQRISVANYWNDPYHQTKYRKHNKFLTRLNNEIESEFSSIFKNNILKLNNMVLIGGPDDDVIEPWQSSQFGFYNSSGDVLPMQERDIFINDTIGLRQLYTENRLKIITVPNVTHKQWHLNTDVIDNHILPYLN